MRSDKRFRGYDIGLFELVTASLLVQGFLNEFISARLSQPEDEAKSQHQSVRESDYASQS